MAYCVYMHTAPNGKKYIGITKRRLEERWEGGNGYRYNDYFFRAILKYGWDNIKHEILFADLSKEEAEQKEVDLIEKYDSANPDNGYNLRLGGSVCSFNEEAIQKMRESHMGYVMPEEQKRKISNAMKGRKVSRGMLGHKHSEETKRKMSNSHTGQVHQSMIGAGNCKAHSVVNLDTGERYDTIAEVCRKYECTHAAIVNCCKGKTKTSCGFRWAYDGGDING